MRSYLYTTFIILAGVIFTLSLSLVTNFVEDLLVSQQVPLNSSSVAGVQKYNIPPISSGAPAPILSAKAVLVEDLPTGTILFQKDSTASLPIASTTKIMTALVSGQYFKPGAILTVKNANKVEGSKVGILAGESLSFRSLLYGMLLNSGNDAAYAIAENYPGGVGGFVAAMNLESQRLGLTHTHFDDPAGFDSPNHYSSASDLAKISEEALKSAQLSRIFSTKETEILSLDKKNKHHLANLNRLLSEVSGVLGIKTGKTEAAKENLVTLVERGKHPVLLVVLGSDDRFGESTRLIEWVYGNFTWSQ